jgi:prevent-host-death family protein
VKEGAVAITTLSSREFNQDSARAKRAARNGPVFITDRGRPAHVLLSIKEYQQITKKSKSIIDLIAMPDAELVDFDPPRLGGELFQPVDLS